MEGMHECAIKGRLLLVDEATRICARDEQYVAVANLDQALVQAAAGFQTEAMFLNRALSLWPSKVQASRSSVSVTPRLSLRR